MKRLQAFRSYCSCFFSSKKGVKSEIEMVQKQPDVPTVIVPKRIQEEEERPCIIRCVEFLCGCNYNQNNCNGSSNSSMSSNVKKKKKNSSHRTTHPSLTRDSMNSETMKDEEVHETVEHELR